MCGQASWDDVVLDETLKTAIKRDYKSFFLSEAIYKNFQAPWKPGLILLGVGTVWFSVGHITLD